MEKSFEICVRAFIIRDNKLLVCRRNGQDYYFFPGGHVEFGERAEAALKREIMEEIGIPIKVGDFIGLNENYYEQDGQKHHEFNIVFTGQIGDEEIVSKEDHITYSWIDLSDIAQEKIYPLALRHELLKWLKEKKIFWSSQL